MYKVINNSFKLYTCLFQPKHFFGNIEPPFDGLKSYDLSMYKKCMIRLMNLTHCSNIFYLIDKTPSVIGAKLLKPDDTIVKWCQEYDVCNGQHIGEGQIKVLLVDGVKKVVQSFV